MKSFDEILGADLMAAVASIGRRVHEFEEITRVRAEGSGRGSYRLLMDDGRTLKGRRFRSARHCQANLSLQYLLEGLPFSRVIAGVGSATVEEWISGEPPHPLEITPAQFERLCIVLGSLNTRSELPGSWQGRIRDIEGYTIRLEQQLEQLSATGCLDAQLARDLRLRALAHQPQGAEIGPIHTDFHPRNMVMDKGGTFWIVDNEDLRLGVLDYDVARTWRQWPMTPVQRAAFCDVYGRLRNLESFLSKQVFWAICSLVGTTHFHWRHGCSVEYYLEECGRIADGEVEELWENPDSPALRSPEKP